MRSRGGFDQAKNLDRFYGDRGYPLSAEDRRELTGVLDKHFEPLKADGRVVLLADMVAGFVEDPLLAIAGLDLVPEMVPIGVAVCLGLPLGQSHFRRTLLNLNLRLHRDRDIEGFVVEFAALFDQLVRGFLHTQGFDRTDPLGSVEFASLRRAIKDDLLLASLFPYNNEKVCHGSTIRGRLIEPLIANLGPEAAVTLTAIDEPGTLRLARDGNILSEDEVPALFPDLDYVEAREPNRSFRRSEARTP
jgi:hypothetical protein